MSSVICPTPIWCVNKFSIVTIAHLRFVIDFELKKIYLNHRYTN